MFSGMSILCNHWSTPAKRDEDSIEIMILCLIQDDEDGFEVKPRQESNERALVRRKISCSRLIC